MREIVLGDDVIGCDGNTHIIDHVKCRVLECQHLGPLGYPGKTAANRVRFAFLNIRRQNMITEAIDTAPYHDEPTANFDLCVGLPCGSMKAVGHLKALSNRFGGASYI